jgi:hypothetical protein
LNARGLTRKKYKQKKDTAEAPSVRALLHLTFYIGNLAFGIWHAFTISRAPTLTIIDMPPRWGWWCRGGYSAINILPLWGWFD